jgi:hypothetical protein
MKLTRIRAMIAAVGMLALITNSATNPTRAQPPRSFIDGNELLDRCSAAKESFRETACLAYIEGVVDGASSLAGLLNRTAGCPPAGLTVGQSEKLVVRYLTAHVDQRQNIAAGSVLRSLSEAFHCSW